MRRNTLNFIVDALTLLTMLVMVSTGLLIKYILPPRLGTGVHKSLADMDRHEWGEIHFWAAVVLGALLLLHVALHWKWVCATVQGWLARGQEKPPVAAARVRNAYGIGFLVVVAAIVAGLLWVASANVQTGRGEHERGAGRGAATASGEHERGGRRAGQQASDFHIRGSMTLGEVAEVAGVPLAALCAELDLPDDTSPDTRLGHLRRDRGVELSAVREAMRRLREERPTQP